VRWGTELHDRFMLPHFVAAGLRRRHRATCARRLSFEASGSRRISSSASRARQISRARHRVELRHALEPWHVMGEEGAAGGTVRYVDSSVERLQVKVTRHGRRPLCADLQRPAVPLRPPARSASLSPACATAPGTRRLPASDHRRARAAGLRPGRHLDEALAGRLPVSRRASRAGATTRPTRSMPTRPRPPPGALLPFGHTPGVIDATAPRQQCRLPVYARLAAILKTLGAGRTPAPSRATFVHAAFPAFELPEENRPLRRNARRGRQRSRVLATVRRPPDAATPEQMRHRLDYVRRRISRTASPTTSMPTPRAPTGRGSSIRCR
jgi:hypothetical protein